MLFRLCGAVLVLTLAEAAQQPPQQPVIRGGVELVLVDVQVTSKDGTPALGLKADQFEVTIDGNKRPVASLDFVQFAPREGAAPAAPAAAGSAGAIAREGRTIIIGVDQSSIQIASEPAAHEAVTRLIAMANPEDAIGLVGFPQPGISVAPTRDRDAIRGALKRIGGQLQIPRTRMNISLAEAADFTARDMDARQRLIARECPQGGQVCVLEVEQSCVEIAGTFEMQALRSISGLHSLMEAVREYPGRKTVVVISAGFATSDRIGGRPDIRLEADLLGQRAAEANAVLYSLHLDVSFLTTFSAANAGRGIQTVFRNSGMFANGLERFTGSAGGTLITVNAGPDPALRRLLRETSSYYMLAVEALPAHRDGKVHRIQVKVKQGGAQVRSRTAVFIPKAQQQP